MPDYCVFTDPWEQSLYSPLRSDVNAAIQYFSPVHAHVIYLAPGPHAPALCDRRNLKMVSEITLMDIDAEVVDRAESRLRAYANPSCPINRVSIDFTAGAGERLAETLLNLLASPAEIPVLLESPEAILEEILPESSLTERSEMLFDLACQSGLSTRGAVCFSEMVASFTGTAVLMAFRTELYLGLGATMEPGQLDQIMAAAIRLWQRYNDRVFKLHLLFMNRLVYTGGKILIAVDTEKIFDDAAIPKGFSFSQEEPPLHDVAELRFQNVRDLMWRDHPFGFDVSVGRIKVIDFKSHQHKVKLYTYEKR